MRKTNGMTRETTAFLYERLSRDDNLEGDSYSIQNQKKLLTKVAKEKRLHPPRPLLRRRHLRRYNGQAGLQGHDSPA